MVATTTALRSLHERRNKDTRNSSRIDSEPRKLTSGLTNRADAGSQASEEDRAGARTPRQQPCRQPRHVGREGPAVLGTGGGKTRAAQGSMHEANGVSGVNLCDLAN